MIDGGGENKMKRRKNKSAFTDKDVGALSAMEMKKGRNKLIYWGIFALLFLLALICILPPLWILISSFKTPQELMQIPPTLIPEIFDFSKFA